MMISTAVLAMGAKLLWDNRDHLIDDEVDMAECVGLLGKYLYKKIKKVVNTIINASNLRSLVKGAINEQNNKALRKELGNQIQIYVNSKKGNVISVDVLAGMTQKPVVQVELTGTAVAADVYAGLKM